MQRGGFDRQLLVRWQIRLAQFVFRSTWLKSLTNWARVQRQMLQDLGREPTPEELARELDMTPEKVVEVQKYGREPISLHTATW